MATTGSLRRRIRSLESDLDALRRQQEDTRRRIEKEQAQRAKELRAQMRRELEQSRAQTLLEVDRRTNELQAQLFEQIQQQADELRAFDERAQRERQHLVEQLSQVNDELAAELDAIKRQEQQRTEAGRAMAEELAGEASRQRETVEALPHAFFCSGQLDVLTEHLSQVQTFLDQGMCEAASSTADMCLSELQILEINVRSLQHEWEDLFAEYRGQASMLHQLMEQFEANPVASPMDRQGFALLPEDRDDWSRGAYTPIHDEIEQAFELVRDVEEEGVTAFLSAGTAPRGRQLVQAITGLHRLSDRLLAAITCIKNELYLSDGREMLGDFAESVLAEQGYTRVSAGYRDDDPLESYVLELTLNRIDVLTLTFVPVRENGVAVRNTCLLSVDVTTTPGSGFVQQLAGNLADTLNERYRLAGLPLEVKWDGAGAMPMARVETQQKAVPDMRLFVRHIERKYQQ